MPRNRIQGDSTADATGHAARSSPVDALSSRSPGKRGNEPARCASYRGFLTRLPGAGRAVAEPPGFSSLPLSLSPSLPLPRLSLHRRSVDHTISADQEVTRVLLEATAGIMGARPGLWAANDGHRSPGGWRCPPRNVTKCPLHAQDCTFFVNNPHSISKRQTRDWTTE